MTNEEIIANEQGRLASEGILKMVKVGEDVMPEPIHTFAKWKELGFAVKKGEHAVAKIMIWKGITKKNEKEEDETKVFMKLSAFFAWSQVKKIEA